jgi:S1-C subfamily serine protease
MITSDAIQRTLHLRHGNQIATSFLIDVDSRQYLVTARHVLPNVTGETTGSILHDGKWKDVPLKLVGHAPGEADISVLSMPGCIANSALELLPDATGLSVGQDVYFLGFPFGLFGEMGNLNTNYPVPFVKKATVSCFEHNTHGLHRVYLDGHNNPGFSGGPVVFRSGTTNKLHAAAVVSGYRYESQPVFQGDQSLPLSTRHNTGIIHTFGIGYAVSLIRSNPIGPRQEA